MKKTISSIVVLAAQTLIFFGMLAPVYTYAQGAVPTPPSCTDASTCGANSACVSNICRVACKADSECGTSQSCQSGGCVDKAASTAAPAATAPSAAGTFTPLNPIPGLFDGGNAPSLPTFFNGLYKICIGVAATIAVLQIMRAGFLFMVNQGSVSHNEAAKSLLTNSILGLVLVLSPAIVFGIINPKILSLSLDVSGLQPSVSSSTVAGQFNGADAYLWEHTPAAGDAAACTAASGTLSYQCRKKDESGGKAAGKDDTCASDENKYSVCSPSGSAPSSGDACKVAYGSDIKAINLDGTTFNCDASAGYAAVPHGCCTGSPAAGTLCCAKPPGQNYLLAYYVTKKNTSTNYSCYVSAVGSYPSADTCATAKANAPTTIGQAQGDTTVSSIQYVKSCEATTDTSYTMPAPNNLPKCP